MAKLKAFQVEAELTDTLAVSVWAESPEQARAMALDALRDGEARKVRTGQLHTTRVAEAR